tara:strand:- start:1179 stop:1346 length:168 start_codon:yes stop_codon:yes gene_type:complete
MKEYTKQETEFKKLHQQLLDLKLYDLASDFSSNFWNYGHNKYVAGIDTVKEIYKL